MPRRGSNAIAFFLLGGYDLRGTLTTFEDTRLALLERTDTLGDTYEEHSFVGVRTGEISQKGFFDDDAALGHGAITTGLGIARILTYGIGGTATGAEFVGYASAVEVSYRELAARGELHKAEAMYRTGGPVETGKVLRTYNVASATGKTDQLDGAASSTGLAAYLQYNASAGEANIRVMHSASNGATAGVTLFTFAKTASGFGAERLSTTGVAQRYTWVDVTTASATGSIGALNYFVGLVRGLTS